MNTLSNLIATFSEKLLKFDSLIIYPLMVLIVFADVLLRFVANSPLPWGNELTCLILILAVFTPCEKVEEEDANIKLDVLYVRMNGTLKKGVKILSSLLAGMWAAFTCIPSFLEVFSMIELHETGIEFEYQIWPFRLMLAIATFLLLIRACLNTIQLCAKK